jgi:hypothetical protein
VRQWVVRLLLKRGIWGSGLDGLLTGLRTVLQKSHGAWPLDALETELSRRGKALRFQAAEVDDLSALEYGEARVSPLLALLYPGVDTTQQFHVDHIFPKSRFTKSKLKADGVPEQLTDDYIRDANRIPNLQLLPGAANIAKQASLPVDWLTSHFSEDAQRQQWLLTYDATGLPTCTRDFGTFFDGRRARLRARLEGLLGVDPAGSGDGGHETAAEKVDEGATLV